MKTGQGPKNTRNTGIPHGKQGNVVHSRPMDDIPTAEDECYRDPQTIGLVMREIVFLKTQLNKSINRQNRLDRHLDLIERDIARLRARFRND